MHVAHGGRDGFDFTALQPVDWADRGEGPRAALEPLRQLSPAQYPYKAPDGVVVHRRGLSWTPDEAHDAEALAAVAVQQVLLVAGRIGLGVGVGQPVVAGDQPRQQPPALGEDQILVQGLIDQGSQGADEVGQPSEVGAVLAGCAHRFTART